MDAQVLCERDVQSRNPAAPNARSLFLRGRSVGDSLPLACAQTSCLQKSQDSHLKSNISTFCSAQMGLKMVDVAMLDATGPGRPSLDRLKALDTLASLDEQIREASDFCNASHRAEMVLKWLVGKLQNDANARSDAACWKLFEKCTRIIEPEKLSLLLARFDLINVLRTAVSGLANADVRSCLGIIAQLIDTLAGISNGMSGAGVKRLLSTDGVSAAAFFETWTCRLLEAIPEGESTSHPDTEAALYLVASAITIWKLRKPSASDNVAVAERCLIPCASMLRRIRDLQVSTTVSPRKRASGSDSLPTFDAASALETLLARHVLLPSRAVVGSSQPGVDTAAMTSIGVMLKALRNASGDKTMHRRIAPVVLELLRVSLKCVPLHNSRQQAKERAWIESVFTTLLNCLIKDKVMANIHTVAEMIEIIGTKTSLSVHVLRNVIQQYCRLADDDEVFDADLELIAAIIKLDANAFVDATLLGPLFKLLTRHDTSAWEGLGHASACTTSGLKGRIVIPVLAAYAKARRLDEFLVQWLLILSTSDFGEAPSIFTELDDCLTDVLEQYMTGEQIGSLISQYRPPSALLQAENDLQDPSPLRASIVVSNALLQGVESDDVVDHLHEQLGQLLHDLQHTLPFKCIHIEGSAVERIDVVVHGHFWSLFRQVLQLWLPRWVPQQTLEQQVVDRLCELQESPIMRLAHTFSNRPQHFTSQSPGVSGHFDAAQLLTSLLDCWRHDRRGLDHSSEAADSKAVSTTAAVSHPVLLRWQTPESLEAQVNHYVNQIRELAPGTRYSEIAKSPLLAGCTAVLQTNAPATKMFVSKLISELTISGVYDNRKRVVVTLLNEVSVSILSYSDRRTIIDGLLDSLAAEHEDQAEYETKGGNEAGFGVQIGSFGLRLSLIAKLVRLPHHDCKLDTHAEALSQLGALVDIKVDSQAYGTYLDWVDIFADIVKTVLSRQLASFPKSQAFAMQLQKALCGLDEREVPEYAGEPLCYYLLDNAILQMVDKAAAVPALASIVSGRQSDFLRHATRRLSLLEEYVNPKNVTAKSDEKVATTMGIWCDDLRIYLSSPPLSEMHSLKNADVAITMRNLIAWCRARSTNSPAELSAISARTALQAYKVASLITSDDEKLTLGMQLLGDRQPPQARYALAAILTENSRNSSLKVLQHMRELSDSVASPLTAAEIIVIQHRVSAVSKMDLDAEAEQSVRNFFVDLLTTVRSSPSYPVHRAATSCILTILTERSFLINQHLAELTLASLYHLASTPTSRAFPLTYLDICAIFSALVKHHRAKLHDRLHLLIPVLQSLLAALFTPIKHSASSTRAHKALGEKQARSFTRLVTLLCNPPSHHSHKSKSGSNNLVDTSRVARRHIGSFVPLLLHTYCAQILNGTLGEGVREALQAGLWAMVEAMESHGPDVVKALSAAMNASERSILREVHKEWKRFAKWEGA